MDSVGDLGARVTGQRVLPHYQQRWRINVECDQVAAGDLQVADLMDVGVLAAAAETGSQLSRRGGIDVALWRAIEDGFCAGAGQHTHSAAGATVIVDRAALPGSP